MPALSNATGWRIFSHCPTASTYDKERPEQIVKGGTVLSLLRCSLSCRICDSNAQSGGEKGVEIHQSRSVINNFIMVKFLVNLKLLLRLSRFLTNYITFSGHYSVAR